MQLQLALENNESAFMQKATADSVRVLTWATFVRPMSPLRLTFNELTCASTPSLSHWSRRSSA